MEGVEGVRGGTVDDQHRIHSVVFSWRAREILEVNEKTRRNDIILFLSHVSPGRRETERRSENIFLVLLPLDPCRRVEGVFAFLSGVKISFSSSVEYLSAR